MMDKININFHFKKDVSEGVLDTIWGEFFDIIGLFEDTPYKKALVCSENDQYELNNVKSYNFTNRSKRALKKPKGE